MFNLDGKIGGDANLSLRGEMYAKKLPALVRESVGVSLSLVNFPFLLIFQILAIDSNTDKPRMIGP